MSYKVVGYFSEINQRDKGTKISSINKVSIYSSVVALAGAVVAFSLVGDVVEASNQAVAVEGFLQNETINSIFHVVKSSI